MIPLEASDSQSIILSKDTEDYDDFKVVGDLSLSSFKDKN